MNTPILRLSTLTLLFGSLFLSDIHAQTAPEAKPAEAPAAAAPAATPAAAPAAVPFKLAVPLPEGVKSDDNADFAKSPLVEFSQKHSDDFRQLDPFASQRKKNTVPPMRAVSFSTTQSPREVYLFYKHYFNAEARKKDDDRMYPYFAGRDASYFDVKDEGDVPKDPAVAAAVFYVIEARGEKGRRLDICIFREAPEKETLVYLLSFENKPTEKAPAAPKEEAKAPAPAAAAAPAAPAPAPAKP